jgi:fatty acid desaturase
MLSLSGRTQCCAFRTGSFQTLEIGHDNTQRTSPDPTTEIMRANWEWSGRYALIWIVVTLFIFGAIFAVLDYGDASESIRIQSFVLLATITLLDAIWRAVGALAARIESMLNRMTTR